MNIHDPKLTVRLEPALKWLVDYPDANLAVVANKYDVEPADLGAWLREYNHGSTRGLTDARILEVKGQSGGLVVRSAGPKKPKTISDGRPAGGKDGSSVPSGESGLHHAAATPEREPGACTHRRQSVDAADGRPSDPPWGKLKQVRVASLARNLPALDAMALGLGAAEACARSGITIGGFYTFKCKFFGPGPVDPRKVGAFRRFLIEHGLTDAAPATPGEMNSNPPAAVEKRTKKNGAAPASLELRPGSADTPPPNPIGVEFPVGVEFRIQHKQATQVAPVVVPIALRISIEFQVKGAAT